MVDVFASMENRTVQAFANVKIAAIHFPMTLAKKKTMIRQNQRVTPMTKAVLKKVVPIWREKKNK